MSYDKDKNNDIKKLLISNQLLNQILQIWLNSVLTVEDLCKSLSKKRTSNK